jgi:hypothetical protein
MPNMNPLGHARVYRHAHTGELVVDTDSLRRTSFAGVDIGSWDDDFEGHYEDDDDEFEGDDIGFFKRDPERRRKRRERRMARKRSRLGRRTGRRTDRLDRKAKKWGVEEEEDEPVRKQNRQQGDAGWGMTAVGGVQTLAAAGPATLRLRLQHDFRADDITFTGSSPGATVTSIFFGDRVVWSTSDGIDVSVFAVNGFLRGLLKGQSLKAGLDITINGSLTDVGVFSATLTGKKPVSASC